MATTASNPAATAASLRCTNAPFAFPFNPLGLSLFDTDPSRILAILHHQTLLAEEALRYRGMLASPKDSAAAVRCNQQPFFEMLSKEHDYMLKRSAALFKPSNFMRQLHPFGGSIQDLMPAPKPTMSHQHQPSSRHRHRSSTPTSDRTSRTSTTYNAEEHFATTEHQSSPVIVADDIDDDDDDRILRHRSPRPEGYISKRASGGMHLRYNPMTSVSTAPMSPKEKSPSSSSASSSPLLLRPLPESALLQECSIEEETKCVVCNATFPSVWLLEQHAALQHANLGGGLDEKPFICDQCGQSYRYRSAYVKHREQNHRARLPADKLFTCDVCGMQFRYLKSFKKHRLNHALERLHGKNERRAMEYGGGSSGGSGAACGELLVSSSNEMGDIGDEHHQFTIKAEVVDEDDDQDDTVDSLCVEMQQKSQQEAMMDLTAVTRMSMAADEMHHGNISSSAENITACGHRQLNASGQSAMNNNIDARNFILKQPRFMHPMDTDSSMPSTSSISSLINSDRIPSEQALGLNPQEASILNFLRVDAAEKQRDRSRFACPFCGKCVRSKENLKLHVRKHTGERPFVCLFCGRAFGGKSDLTRHLRIHTGERPYHCEACGKCFARADYLSKHLTTHVHNSPR